MNTAPLAPSLKQSVALPIVSTSKLPRLTVVGGDAAFFLSRTTSGDAVIVAGVDAPVQTDVSSALAPDVRRVIGLVAYDGGINTSTSAAYAAGTASPFKLYGGCSKDGVRIYAVGSRAFFGVVKQDRGLANAGAGTKIDGTSAAIAACAVYNNALYVVAAQTSAAGLVAPFTNFAPAVGVVDPASSASDGWGLPLTQMTSSASFGAAGRASAGAGGLLFLNATLVFVSDPQANAVLAYSRPPNAPNQADADAWRLAGAIAPIVISLPVNSPPNTDDGPQGLALSRDSATLWVQTAAHVFAFSVAQWAWLNDGAPIVTARPSTLLRGVALAPELLPFNCYEDLLAQPNFAARFAHASVAILALTNSSGSLRATCNTGFFGSTQASLDMTCIDRTPVPLSAAFSCSACLSALPSPAPYGSAVTATAPATFSYACLPGYFSSASPFVFTCDPAQTAAQFAGVAGAVQCADCNPTPNTAGPANYCLGGAARALCPAGRYGAPDASGANLDTAACSGFCDAGFYCPSAGETRKQAIACGNVTVHCPAGSTTPLFVDAGYFSVYYSGSPPAPSVQGLTTTRTAQLACPADRQCGSGLLQPAVDLSASCGLGLTSAMTDATNLTAFGATFAATTPGWTSPTRTLAWSVVSTTPIDAGCSVPSGYFSVASVTGASATGQLHAGAATLSAVACSSGITVVVEAARTALADPSPAGDVVSARCTLTVSVAQTVRAPVINSCAGLSVPERQPLNTPNAGALNVTNLNIGTTLLYTIESSVSSPAPGMTLPYSIGCDGALVVSQTAYYKKASAYAVTVRVDNTGFGVTMSASCTFTLNVTRVPVPPTLTTSAFYLSDLAINGTAVGSVGLVNNNNVAGASFVDVSLAAFVGTPPSPNWFAVDAGGSIAVHYPPGTPSTTLLDATLKSTYSYSLNASDSVSWAVYPVVINLVVSPRPPATYAQARSVSDAAQAGDFVPGGALVATHPQGVAFAFSLADTSGAAQPFAILPNGTLYLAVAPLVFNTQALFNVAFAVTDTNGKTAFSSVAIAVLDSNKAPFFVATAGSSTPLSGAAAMSAPEGTTSGAFIGQLFAADANLRDTLTFGLASCAPAAATAATQCPFAVDAASGAVSVSSFASGVLMYDRDATYPTPRTVVLNVTVRDNGAPQFWASTLVQVLIASISPRFAGATASASIAGDAAAGASVLALGPLVWSAYGASGLSFAISPAFTAENAAAPVFAVSPTTGAITVSGAAAWNFNTKRTFVFSATATETNAAAGGFAASTVVTVRRRGRLRRCPVRTFRRARRATSSRSRATSRTRTSRSRPASARLSHTSSRLATRTRPLP